MRSVLLLSIAIAWLLPAPAAATTGVLPVASSVFSFQYEDSASSLRPADDAVKAARFRALRAGRGLTAATIGIQGFQVVFSIMARALSFPVGPWAAGDSMVIEGIVALISIPAAPLGVLGFKKLAEDPRRGVATGLLEGGIYALSYAGLHLLFTGISEALPSGGQGGGFALIFVGVPIMVTHAITGLGMTIAGAVRLAKVRREGPSRTGNDGRSHAPSARRAASPVLLPLPLFCQGGGGLRLLAVF